MADPLGQGRILPAARPVDAFITPAQVQAAAPARPESFQMSNAGIGLQGTASKPNVAGYNPGEQLAEALSNFAPQLTKTLQTGLNLYASHEYQSGQNEAMRAFTLADRQVQQGAAEYGAANRALSRRDPIAAMAMDQTNPFRAAGRKNALSQLAGSEIGSAITQAYNARSTELVLKDPTDPALNEVKAAAITQVLTKYGLDEGDSGFIDYVLPSLNRAWEKTTAQHVQDRNKYLKDTVPRVAAASLAQMVREGRSEGRDMNQIITRLGTYLDGQATTLGIDGEPMEMKLKAIQAARQMLTEQGELEGAKALGAIPVGPPDEAGWRPTAAQMFPLELMEGDDKYGEIRRRTRERELEPLKDELGAQVSQIGIEMEDGPDKLQAIQGLINDPKYAAIPLADRLELVGKTNKLGEEILSQGYDPNAAGDFLGTLDETFGFGSQRDMAAAEARLQDILQRTPQEDRPKVRKAFQEWKNQTQKQPWELINPAITTKIKAELARVYGTDPVKAAALRQTGNLEQVLGWGDAQAQLSSQRQLSAYRTHVLTRLDEARTKKGSELSSQESQAVINKALQEYGSKDQDAKAFLFPTPQDAGAPAGPKPPAAPVPPAGTKPTQVQGASNPTALDNLPDRQTRLQNWKSQPLLNLDATTGLVVDALNGKPLPASFRRAAKDAGVTPEKLLIQQADFYGNGLKLSPAERNQILKKGNQAQALNDSRETRAAAPSSLLARGAGWMFDAVMGVRPAMAANSEEVMLRRYGGGSSQWSSGPAVAASHPETGSGYTLPGMKDASGRPVVLSRAGANSFAAMIRDSGGQVKAGDVASAQRSKSKNSAVGGVAGSEHLGGNAMDIHGSSIAWIRKNGAKYGWYVNDYKGSHGGHVEFRGGGSAGGSSGGNWQGYMKRLSYLETRLRNIPNAEGSQGRGYFQAFDAFDQEARAASGGISARDGNYNRAAQSAWAWIEKHNKRAAAAIKAGRYDEADRLLRNTWPSLPGGSQAQPDQVQREARRYLGG